jgi:hypothetical protein
MAEQRQQHHLQDNANCNLCGRVVETIHHLPLACVYSREVWARILQSIGLLNLCPMQDDALTSWWLHAGLQKSAEFFEIRRKPVKSG